ncbi:uncharacterized protein TNCV_4394051 [Trichonephila clavipes]|uniref:Uncharacterized protein n=1 Tax=Trichonephila clavipes TaxID=2585209 RepID=A0A8X6W572_TRICX|nr:uncharacterized protein TNCV_4394051 [Trichonephila clavipes]
MNQRFTSVDTHNVRIWSLENPHEVLEPKLNVFCAISRRKVFGPFVFGEPIVTDSAYLDALQLCLFPQLEEKNKIISFSSKMMHRLTGISQCAIG